MNELKNGTILKAKTMDQLNRRYQVTERGVRAVTVFLENKVKAASTKIKFLWRTISLFTKTIFLRIARPSYTKR